MHFNGAMQRSFRLPLRAWESIYYHRKPMPFECEYREFDLDNGLYEHDPGDEEGSAYELRRAKEEGEEADNRAATMYAKRPTPPRVPACQRTLPHPSSCPTTAWIIYCPLRAFQSSII